MRIPRRRGALLLAVVFISISAAVAPRPSAAHPLAPALLEIRDLGGGKSEVTWKTSNVRLPGTNVRPLLPETCRADSEPIIDEHSSYVVTRWTVLCDHESWTGRTVGVQGLLRSGTDALVRVVFPNGRIFRAVASGEREVFEVPGGDEGDSVLVDYGRLGVEHILGGFDHLLFVFGLLLLVTAFRSLLATVTSFTIGHSITLSLAILGFVDYPAGPIEVLIAMSVFALAVELAREAAAGRTLLGRRPWLMALLFGLLHGLGFAGALGEVGLPDGEVPLALFSFNVGIETGQLAFVAVILLLHRFLVLLLGPVTGWGAFGLWGRRASVYTMGSLAAMWMLERAIGLL